MTQEQAANMEVGDAVRITRDPVRICGVVTRLAAGRFHVLWQTGEVMAYDLTHHLVPVMEYRGVGAGRTGWDVWMRPLERRKAWKRCGRFLGASALDAARWLVGTDADLRPVREEPGLFLVDDGEGRFLLNVKHP